MSLKAMVFDLDGTLLDTLPDLVALTNAVMDARGYPRHTAQEVLTYIGDGARMLMRRAVPPYVPDDQLDACMQLWHDLYSQVGYGLTKPYPHMHEALAQLKAGGVALGVLSNKFDEAVQDTINAFFPDVFDAVRGEGPATPRKPNPHGLLAMMAELGTEQEETAFVGDTGGTDIAVAVAAGVLPVGVSWGYHDPQHLWDCGAAVVVDDPLELAALARKQEGAGPLPGIS